MFYCQLFLAENINNITQLTLLSSKILKFVVSGDNKS